MPTKQIARATPRPELAERRRALSVLSNSRTWRRMRDYPDLKFHCSYVRVPGAIAGSDCHHWIGVISNEGYGRFTVGGETVPAHRYRIEVIDEEGKIPGRVTRTCGDTACVNSDHLRWDDTPIEWDSPADAPRLSGEIVPRRAVARFWRNVDKEGLETCWRWTGTKGPQNYGQITIREGWVVSANRLAYAIAHGSIPDDRPFVCHGPECEGEGGAGTLCVNPDHLIAGTPADNSDDKNGGHYRRPISAMPLSPDTREGMVAFLPVTFAIGKEEGDLPPDLSYEEFSKHALYGVGGAMTEPR